MLLLILFWFQVVDFIASLILVLGDGCYCYPILVSGDKFCACYGGVVRCAVKVLPCQHRSEKKMPVWPF